jgi:hypothetical protein
MQLKPIPKALGMNPAHWLRFTFISKQVWWDERRSHTPRNFTFRQRDHLMSVPQAMAAIETIDRMSTT